MADGSAGEWRRKDDVFVPSMAAKEQSANGSGSGRGRRVIFGLVRGTVERVRRSAQVRAAEGA
jgi:hypothetical protein